MGQELTDRQAQLPTTRAPGQRAALVSECPGRPGSPYCKRLVLNGARAKDTGYYRCYYKDVKAIIVGTTAVSTYVFVRGESHSHTRTMLTQTHLKIENEMFTLFTSLAQHEIFISFIILCQSFTCFI